MHEAKKPNKSSTDITKIERTGDVMHKGALVIFQKIFISIVIFIGLGIVIFNHDYFSGRAWFLITGAFTLTLCVAAYGTVKNLKKGHSFSKSVTDSIKNALVEWFK